MPKKSQSAVADFACCGRKCSIRITPSSDQGSQRIEGVNVLADPPHLSRHQRTTSTPPLSSSFRSSKPKTSNPSYHRNQQYSIVGLTNAAGTLVERYSYTAYGTLGIYDPSGTVRTTSTYANRYTYTGREFDADLNLYHFRARWYDPSTGGFVSRDPLGYVDGMSLYRGYFGITNLDPLGREVWIVVRAFGNSSCGEAIWNNSAHLAGYQSHFYLVVKRADGLYYSFSFHPDCWAKGMWDANRENKSRIWCNDPKNLMGGSLPEAMYSWYLIEDGLGKEEELIESILTWGLENGVGFEIGGHKRLGPDRDGNEQSIGSSYHSPNTDWNDGRLDCPYQVGGTNCAWWSHSMLKKCNIKSNGPVSLAIGRLNLSVGSTVHLPSTTQIENTQRRTIDWGGYTFDWREFVNSVCPRGGFYVGP